jgi:hypothetical protein
MNDRDFEKVVLFAQSSVGTADKRAEAIHYLLALKKQGAQTALVEELLAILK